jgi:AraC family transcriptional regulator of arabinose operon
MMDEENEKFMFIAKSINIPINILEKEGKNKILSNLMVLCAGYFKEATHHIIQRSSIDEYILIYCTEGKGFLEIGNIKHVINKGDILFCFKNTPHFYYADEKEPWTIYWAHFNGQTVSCFLDVIEVSTENPVLHIGLDQKILSQFHEVFNILSKGYSLCNLIYASTCFQEILSYLFKLKTYSSLSKEMDIDIQQIINIMLENINTTFSLEQFANQIHVSKYHFSRKFKDKTGYSPIDYFIHLKIQKACELLDTTDMKIFEISNLLGYKNQYYFSLAFKKTIGCSPKHYKLKKGV